MPNSMPSAFSIRLDIGAAPKKKDRKSTRLNSSHSQISYAVFCLKKKKNNRQILPRSSHIIFSVGVVLMDDVMIIQAINLSPTTLSSSAVHVRAQSTPHAAACADH